MIKFLKYLVCYIIYPFSFLTVRRRRRWAFGSFRGAFNDNAKYMFIYTCLQYRDIEAVWISTNRATVQLVRSYGLPAYSVFSIKGLLYALTSKYWIFNSYTSDIMFCLSGNAVCINLWHGVPLKRIEFNIKRGALSDRYVRKTLRERYYHPEAFRRPDVVLSSTPFQSAAFASAFRIAEDRCINMGYPRNHILICSEEERRAFIEKFEPEQTRLIIDNIKQKYRKVLVYMPTWRDSQRDIFTQSIDLSRLNDSLASKDYFLILKPHSNTLVDSRLLDGLSNIALLDSTVDIYAILPYTDVLITDYSSILYDYVLMCGKDIILYLYDYEDYVRERDFTYPFDENVVGKRVYTFEELLACINSDTYGIDEAQRKLIVDRFWGDTPSTDACADIVEYVKSL